jgi:hypothetical protein
VLLVSGRAQELRAARELFERATRDGVSMAEARRRIHEERWQAISGRLARRAAGSLCGTEAPAFVQVELPIDDSNEGLQWWQK